MSVKIEYIEMKTKRDLSDTLYFTNSLCRNFPDDRINGSNIDSYFDLIRITVNYGASLLNTRSRL
jgi:hypothetical protein